MANVLIETLSECTINLLIEALVVGLGWFVFDVKKE